MEIETIFPNYLYSIKYEEEQLNEYHRLFKEWTDKEVLLSFFTANKGYLGNYIWGDLRNEPEKAAAAVIKDAHDLEKYINYVMGNVRTGKEPGLDQYFQPLNGKYVYQWELVPMKGYGKGKPSFIRLYAIKIESNCYIIVYGGLKLCRTIQDSPVLKDNVFRKIDRTLAFLRSEGFELNEDK